MCCSLRCSPCLRVTSRYYVAFVFSVLFLLVFSFLYLLLQLDISIYVTYAYFFPARVNKGKLRKFTGFSGAPLHSLLPKS